MHTAAALQKYICNFPLKILDWSQTCNFGSTSCTFFTMMMMMMHQKLFTVVHDLCNEIAQPHIMATRLSSTLSLSLLLHFTRERERVRADEKCKIICNQNSNKFCIGDPPLQSSLSSSGICNFGAKDAADSMPHQHNNELLLPYLASLVKCLGHIHGPVGKPFSS